MHESKIMSYVARNLPADKHCFFGSSGGVSTGKYDSLNTNLSSADSHEHILRNFDIIATCFSTKRTKMVTLRQSVTDTVFFADKPSWFTIEADGVITKKEYMEFRNQYAKLLEVNPLGFNEV